MSQSISIPPNEPVNPFPRPEYTTTNKAGITNGIWEEFLQLFLHQHPGYAVENWDVHGVPFKGELHKVWKEVQFVHETIMKHYPIPNHITRFRQDLRNMVAKAGRIENAVCLGLGEVYSMGSAAMGRTWIEQCGMFLALCQIIEEKQGMFVGSLPIVFQDPAFKLEERYVLETLGGHTVVFAPAANAHMNRQTFVYAPHFPANRIYGSIFGRGPHPEILLTNDLGGSYSGIGAAIAQHYIKNVYWTRNSTVDDKTTAMYNEANRFFQTHEGIRFDGIYSGDTYLGQVLQRAFHSSMFYVRKRWAASVEKGLDSHATQGTELEV